MQNLRSLGKGPATLADLASGKKFNPTGSLLTAAGKKEGAEYLEGLPQSVRDKLLAHESVDPLEFLVNKRRAKFERMSARGATPGGGVRMSLAEDYSGIGAGSVKFDDTPLEHETMLAEYIRSMQTKRLSATEGTLSRTTALDRQLQERAERRREYIR